MSHHSRPSLPVRRARATLIPAFSLVELVVVLAIISIGSGVAIFRFASTSARYRVDFAASRLRHDLHLLQARARAAGDARTLRINAASHAYELVGEPGLQRASTPFTVRLSEEPYGVRITGVQTTDGQGVLVFDGWGQPSQDLSVTIAAGSASRTVSIDRIGGVVVVATP